MTKDWTKATPPDESVQAALNGLEAVFRPLADTLRSDDEPATVFSPEMEELA